MTRFYITISQREQWYAIMSECRAWFGSNWRCQPKVRRRLRDSTRSAWMQPIPVWFEVPDQRFGTWITVKMALQVRVHADPLPINT